MTDQSHLDAMRAAVRGDIERARARNPAIFEQAGVQTQPPAPEPQAPPEPEPQVQPEPEPTPEPAPLPRGSFFARIRAALARTTRR